METEKQVESELPSLSEAEAEAAEANLRMEEDAVHEFEEVAAEKEEANVNSKYYHFPARVCGRSSTVPLPSLVEPGSLREEQEAGSGLPTGHRRVEEEGQEEEEEEEEIQGQGWSLRESPGAAAAGLRVHAVVAGSAGQDPGWAALLPGEKPKKSSSYSSGSSSSMFYNNKKKILAENMNKQNKKYWHSQKKKIQIAATVN